MYAIVKIGAQQFKIEKNQQLNVPYLTDCAKGEDIELNNVLLLKNDDDAISIGAPVLNNVSVKAKIIAHDKERKAIIQKFSRRKRYKKRTGHRQDFSKIKITDIVIK